MGRVVIRFVEDKRNNEFKIKRKTLFGWKYITYRFDNGYGTDTYEYANKDKQLLLDTVLFHYFKVKKENTTIEEHSPIIIYR